MASPDIVLSVPPPYYIHSPVLTFEPTGGFLAQSTLRDNCCYRSVGASEWISPYLHNGRSMVLNYSLNDIEAQLNPSKFFRANRQYIIGIDSIQRINFLFSSKLSVCLKDYPDVEIIVSKEKSGQLKEWIDR